MTACYSYRSGRASEDNLHDPGEGDSHSRGCRDIVSILINKKAFARACIVTSARMGSKKTSHQRSSQLKWLTNVRALAAILLPAIKVIGHLS